jgi:hypothetical protein
VVGDDDLVFEAVRARVQAGDHLDERAGRPGVDTEGGGAFTYTPDGRLQRLYWRGTPEYLAAHAAGKLELLPPLTPASEDAVNECDQGPGRPGAPTSERAVLAERLLPLSPAPRAGPSRGRPTASSST